MHRPAPDPRRNIPERFDPDQPVVAEVVDDSLPGPGPGPATTDDFQIVVRPRRPQAPQLLPGQPPPYEGTSLAVLSWVLAVLAGLVGLLMVVIHGALPLWNWRAGIIVLLTLAFFASLVPLNTKVRPGLTKTHYVAFFGLVLTILSSCWCLVCVGYVEMARYARTPEGRAQLRAMAEERQRREAAANEAWRREVREQQAKAQREADEKRRREQAARKKADEKRRIEQQIAARKQAILDRDREVARRFQYGDDGLPPIEIPSDPTAPPENPGMRFPPPPPPILPQPLVVRPVKLLPRAPKSAASEPPMIERDLRVQPLSVYRAEAVSTVLWSDSGDTAWLLDPEGILLELDARKWQVRRELDLDGPCVGLTRGRSYLLVARAFSGAILAIEPQSLTAVQEIPAAQVEQVAASPASDAVFVRTSQHHCLAVLDLRNRRIAALLTPHEALLLGRSSDQARELLTYPLKFKQLVVPSDGRSLVALGDDLHRWSVVGTNLRSAQDVNLRPDVKVLGFGHHGLRITVSHEVYATDTLAKLPVTQQDFRGASFDRAGRIFDTHVSQSLRVFTRQGTLLSEYAWPDSDGTVGAESAFAAPEGQRVIVFHKNRLYGVDLPPRLGGASPISQARL